MANCILLAFFLCLFFLAVVILLSWAFTKTWAGLACFAVRDNETAASSMGVSAVRTKLTAFVIGTLMAGLAGALYAHYMRFIAADSFAFPGLSRRMRERKVSRGVSLPPGCST